MASAQSRFPGSETSPELLDQLFKPGPKTLRSDAQTGQSALVPLALFMLRGGGPTCSWRRCGDMWRKLSYHPIVRCEAQV